MIIMLIFAAEVAALVFGFIYRGKVRHPRCTPKHSRDILFWILYILWHFSPHQITQDSERSMNEVFMKYDGQSTEANAADYLQTQVCCCLRSLLNFHSHPQLLPHRHHPPTHVHFHFRLLFKVPLSCALSFMFGILRTRQYLYSTVYMCPNVQMLKNMMVLSVWATIIHLCSLLCIYYV